MTDTEAKAFLQSLRSTAKQIAEKDRFLQLMRTQLTLSSGQDNTPRVKASPDPGLERIMCVVLDLEAEKKALEKEFSRDRELTLRCLSRIQKGQYCAVLFFRYICAESWNTICKKMSYSIRRVFQIHGEALSEFAKQMSTEKL
jgi:hypothetical protein